MPGLILCYLKPAKVRWSFKVFSAQHSCPHFGEVDTAAGHMHSQQWIQIDSILLTKPDQ